MNQQPNIRAIMNAALAGTGEAPLAQLQHIPTGTVGIGGTQGRAPGMHMGGVAVNQGSMPVTKPTPATGASQGARPNVPMPAGAQQPQIPMGPVRPNVPMPAGTQPQIPMGPVRPNVPMQPGAQIKQPAFFRDPNSPSGWSFMHPHGVVQHNVLPPARPMPGVPQ